MTLLEAVAEYGAALATKRRLRAERNALACEFFEPQEYSHDPADNGYFDRGVPPCRNAGPPRDEWCEPCRQREAVHLQVLDAKTVLRRAKRRMDDRAVRLAAGVPPTEEER